jgi:hypothetical protein
MELSHGNPDLSLTNEALSHGNPDLCFTNEALSLGKSPGIATKKNPQWISRIKCIKRDCNPVYLRGKTFFI